MTWQARAKAYQHRKLIVRLAGTFGFLLYALVGSLVAGPVVAALAGAIPSRWLLLAVVAGAFAAGFELLSLPLAYYSGFVLEHRFGLSNETLHGWIVRQLKTYLVGAALGAVLVFGLYGLLWYGGRAWWLGLWLGWLGLSVGLAQIFPILILPIFYPSEPVRDGDLTGRLERLAARAGVRVGGVFCVHLSKDTKKANAMLAGLGRTRRVLLSDTLLASFGPEQIEVVFAHELAHHLRGHIGKQIALAGLASTALVAVVAWRLGPFAGSDPALVAGGLAALPQAILGASLAQLVLEPILNAASRRFERQSDLDALAFTGRPDAYRQALEALGRLNLEDPAPHRLVEVLFHDHPALAKRLRLADTWNGARSGGVEPSGQ